MRLLAALERLYLRHYLYWSWRVVAIALFFAASVCHAAKTNKTEHAHEWQDGCVVSSVHPDGICAVIHANPRRTCKTCWTEEESINGEWVQVKTEDKAEKPAKVEKEKKTEHTANKIIVKSRDKGSKKESDWKTDKEFPLMFKNNRKARKPKDN